MPYVATVNVPGYLPMDDEPPVFEDARQAWGYLLDERERGEQDAEEGNNGETYEQMNALANGDSYASLLRELGFTADGQGTVSGPTPGYDGDHDLGLAYTVQYTDEPIPED